MATTATDVYDTAIASTSGVPTTATDVCDTAIASTTGVETLESYTDLLGLLSPIKPVSTMPVCC